MTLKELATLAETNFQLDRDAGGYFINAYGPRGYRETLFAGLPEGKAAALLNLLGRLQKQTEEIFVKYEDYVYE